MVAWAQGLREGLQAFTEEFGSCHTMADLARVVGALHTAAFTGLVVWVVYVPLSTAGLVLYAQGALGSPSDQSRRRGYPRYSAREAALKSENKRLKKLIDATFPEISAFRRESVLKEKIKSEE